MFMVVHDKHLTESLWVATVYTLCVHGRAEVGGVGVCPCMAAWGYCGGIMGIPGVEFDRIIENC